MTDYTDYHQYAWKVVKPPQKPIITFLYRLPLYALIFLLIHANYTIRFFVEMDQGARILTFSLISVAITAQLIVLHFILNLIDRQKPTKLIRYRIDKQGIFIDKRRYPHHKQVDLHFPDNETKQKASAALTHYQKQT